MKYFSMKEDLNAMGWFPQSETYSYEKLIPESMIGVGDLVTNREKELSVPKIKLVRKAHKTDFISTGYVSGGLGILILSTKMWNIFSSYSLPSFSMKPISLIHKRKEYNDYRLFYTKDVFSFTSYYDFERTTFRHKRKNFNKNIEEIKEIHYFKNYKDSLNFEEELRSQKKDDFYDFLDIEEIFLKDKFDWIPVTGPGRHIYEIVSERLKNDLENNEITGLQFEKVDFIK